MLQLNYKLLDELNYQGYLLKDAPERIIQFGEGNFLRGFADYFVDCLNERTGFNGKVLVVQPIENGMSDEINKQQGLYTLYLRGTENERKMNRRRVVSSISRCINPYTQWETLLDTASNEDLRVVISNTTEQGIAYDPACKFSDCPQSSFPGKLTRYLYGRYVKMSGDIEKGFLILSCELIDNNGSELKKCVLAYADQWNLNKGFIQWVESANIFCNTLVDRIVTGYPAKEVLLLNLENGYEDSLMDTAEIFGLWVIEGPEDIAEVLKLENSGLPILICQDHLPYKKRKVRILNGAHTAMVPAAYLQGFDNVRDCVNDPLILKFMLKFLEEEVVPTLPFPKGELEEFIASVIDRFKNPYIDHQLLSISLNSVSKWRTRVLPTILDYVDQYGELPKAAVFSFAALMAFYSGEILNGDSIQAYRGGIPYFVKDSLEILTAFFQSSKKTLGIFVEEICRNTMLWGRDLSNLTGFEQKVKEYLTTIRSEGMCRAMERLLEENE